MQISLAFLSGVLFFSLFHYFSYSVLFLFVSASAFLIKRKNVLLILFLVIGIVYAFLRYLPADDMPDIGNRELRVTGRFIQRNDAQAPGRNSQTFLVEEAWDDASGLEIEGLQDTEIGVSSDFWTDPDDRYELLLETEKERTRLNPGQVFRHRLHSRIIAAEDTGEASSPLFSYLDGQRASLDRYLAANFNGDTAAFLSSITTGNTLSLSEPLRDAFNAAGLAHILSISGTHFGMFSVLLFGLFVFLIKRLPYRHLQRLTIYLSPEQAAAILSIPFMLLYLGISGGSIPALRSFVMINLFLCGLLIDRKGFWLNSLLFAALVLVIWDPGAMSGLSFQLSFIAVLFIGFALEKKDPEEKAPEQDGKGRRMVSYLKNALMLSVAASLGTAPLAAYYFHYVSLISPLSNLIIVPLAGFVVIPLSLASSFAYLFSGHYLFAPFVSASADLTLALVTFFAHIPYAELRVPAFPPVLCMLFYPGFLFYLVSGRKKKLLVLPVVPFLVYAILIIAEKKDLSITFVDVGQGDSAVIDLPDRKTIVMDTGRTGRETAALLRYQGKKDIDALLLTHNHPDHAGGLEYLMKRFKVKELWDNGRLVYPPDLIKDVRHRALERGDMLETAGYRITVLHPFREFYTISEDAYSEENNSSLVLHVAGGTKSFLFAGDSEEEAEEDIFLLRKWLPADVLKVPHHGSRASAADDFIDAISPSVAVISVGRDNSFGHPSQEVLDKFAGKRILRTDQDGAIKILEKGNDLLVKTCREFMFEKADSIETEKKNIKRLFSVW